MDRLYNKTNIVKMIEMNRTEDGGYTDVYNDSYKLRDSLYYTYYSLFILDNLDYADIEKVKKDIRNWLETIQMSMLFDGEDTNMVATINSYIKLALKTDYKIPKQAKSKIENYILSLQDSRGFFYSSTNAKEEATNMEVTDAMLQENIKLASRDIGEIAALDFLDLNSVNKTSLLNWCNESIAKYDNYNYRKEYLQDIELYYSIISYFELDPTDQTIKICMKYLNNGRTDISKVTPGVSTVMYENSLINLEFLLVDITNRTVGGDIIPFYFDKISQAYFDQEKNAIDSIFIVDTFIISSLYKTMNEDLYDRQKIIDNIMIFKLPDSYFVPRVQSTSDILSTFYVNEICQIFNISSNLNNYLKDLYETKNSNDFAVKYRGAILCLLMLQDYSSNDIDIGIEVDPLYFDKISQKILEENIIKDDFMASLLYLRMCKVYNYKIPETLLIQIEQKIVEPTSPEEPLVNQLYQICYQLQMAAYIGMDDKIIITNKEKYLKDIITRINTISKEDQLFSIFFICETMNMYEHDNMVIEGWQEILLNCKKGDIFAYSESQTPSFVSTYYALYIIKFFEENEEKK